MPMAFAEVLASAGRRMRDKKKVGRRAGCQNCDTCGSTSPILPIFTSSNSTSARKDPLGINKTEGLRVGRPCWVVDITSAPLAKVRAGRNLLSTRSFCIHTRLPIIRQYPSVGGPKQVASQQRYDIGVTSRDAAMSKSKALQADSCGVKRLKS